MRRRLAAAGKAGRRWLFLGHRWLGILTGLLFATWFASGLVMLYVGFPALTESERRAGLPGLDWDAVRIAPDAALAAAGAERFPRDLRLAMLDREPVYRVTLWDGTRRTVSARDGHPVAGIDAALALAVAAADPRAVRPRAIGRVGRDQWTVVARYDPLRPFHLIDLGDAAGTRLYVSARTGEIALDTSRTERVWNWLGAIPHWIYPTPLRARAGLWRDAVLWVSGVCAAAAVTGFWIGLLRVRLRRRYRDGRATPYRGWSAWHHVAGLAGGVALIAFIVSGWLSVNPNRWFGPRAPSEAMLERYAGETAPRLALDPAALRSACADAVEIRFRHLAGAPVAAVACRDGGTVTAGLGPERLREAAGRLLPEAGPPEIDRLAEEDAYWHGGRTLPVLRARFADPEATWFHIDPATGEILDRLDRSGRAYRWLFDGLHTLDLGPLSWRPTLRKTLIWILSALGLATAISGTVIGWRRLRRLAAGPRRA
ncbi:PepSY domain-containing protein [Methylobacterium sp. NEAU 140]|uniref:PepSY domain-containing protein n=1 Tax=Methylobacterium sp. NEAU 140 TaxID=3064945 RepID=UPI002732C38C|nr:PepSY domain-containing protein [Methylobacterium sp. NEAU 140]MDP4025446.1 PepSY domain-containing protein [Methylobacterium sp. NEAU 140]